jgi:hypothetical protein
MELNRFCGHLNTGVEEVSDATNERAVSALVSAADGGSGPERAYARGAGRGVRAFGVGYPELGRLEREILKKTAAWFARESNSVPERDTSL